MEQALGLGCYDWKDKNTRKVIINCTLLPLLSEKNF